MTHRMLALAAVVVAGCGGDDPDATVAGLLADRGPWMEDFVWGAGAYTPCSGCEELTVLEFAADHYRLTVYERAPGQPATATIGCNARFDFVEHAIDGFDAGERTVLALTIGTNDCGWTSTGIASSWVFEVVTRDAGGATYLAYWPDLAGTPDAAFPGYDYTGTGSLADPLRLCESAPGTLCEPACNLGAPPPGGCGLAEP